MFEKISGKYRKTFCWPLLIVFQIQMFLPLGSMAFQLPQDYPMGIKNAAGYPLEIFSDNSRIIYPSHVPVPAEMSNKKITEKIPRENRRKVEIVHGPVTPEAVSFKSISEGNLVNLFTGDFSYSIPLLDVEGYPVNLFYNGGITMEQEASWVGLGWNINPGTISRNMRGIPDDFNGNDTLIQQQNIKPNKTWGGEIGSKGLEIFGFKQPGVSLSLGISFNNYLGPELTLGAAISRSIANIEAIKFPFSVEDSIGDSKGGISLGLSGTLSSRSGLTLSPSLNVALPTIINEIGAGAGLSTSYNSRTGIQALNIYSEMSFYAANTTAGRTLSFARPSHLPIVRHPMLHSHTAGQLELGVGNFGLKKSLDINGFYTESRIPEEMQTIRRPMIGYIYSEKAVSRDNAVMDFNRLNDQQVTPHSPVIAAPIYTYDIFNISGEGTGGSFRAYRKELGYMKDAVTVSKQESFSLGFDIAPPAHFGMNPDDMSTPTYAGPWKEGSNTLTQSMQYGGQQNDAFQNVYFRNPAEMVPVNQEAFDRVGGTDLVRFALSGSGKNIRLESKLESFYKETGNKKSSISLAGNTGAVSPGARLQVISMLNAGQASVVGLEKNIRNYTGSFDASNNLLFNTISRTGDYRKPHHISQIKVLEQNGMRYIYGLPVYNVVQKDYVFTVDGAPDSLMQIGFSEPETTLDSRYITEKTAYDGFVQIQETPAYTTSFMLTSLLSPDYADLTGNGISADDPGNAVKFNYTQSPELLKWRTPRNDAAHVANFNEGLKTEKKDNKALISYGEREVWYLQTIESKSMIAIFRLGERQDALGVQSAMDGSADGTNNPNKLLSGIDLYLKSEIKEKGIANALPIKSVNFEYDYSLCTGAPDNNGNGGKLTLKSVSFSYNGQSRSQKEKYVFGYNESEANDNPAYTPASSDRWGTYKDPSVNPPGLNNADYPFTDTVAADNNRFAAAWSLKKIILPSGGQMTINYEADDYAYVQDRRAAQLFPIYGLGHSPNYTQDNQLYPYFGGEENLYVYVQLPAPIAATKAADIKSEIQAIYLEGIEQLAFQLMVKMPRGEEMVQVFSKIEDYGLCANSANNDIMYLKLEDRDGKSPLAESAISFMVQQLPGQAFPAYDIESGGFKAFLQMAGSMLSSLKNAFKNIQQQMRDAGKAAKITLDKSFIRLNDPDFRKYGGGARVKSIVLLDNWNTMAGSYDSHYGKEYEYTTTQMINGEMKIISSGVAAYEPGIGSIENPFREVMMVKNQMPLASAVYGTIETPVTEMAFPAPVVGYSKVTVRSLNRTGKFNDSVVRSDIGKKVVKYYTAKDFPTRTAYTPMESHTYHMQPILSFLKKRLEDCRTVSQGFLVENNDMHGKIKSEETYSASNEKDPLSGTWYYYKNTGAKGAGDKMDFAYIDSGGLVKEGYAGIDVELMTDVREFRISSSGLNAQMQVDVLYFLIPIPIPTLFPLRTSVLNRYRAVSTLKLINYHAMIDSMVVMDKGSVVSSKPMLYDALTGNTLVTRTTNEYNDPVYTVSYPAYWAYSGMGPAWKNTGILIENVDFYEGRITSSVDTTLIESGDEFYILSRGSGSAGCVLPTNSISKIWALDLNKEISTYSLYPKDLIFMDVMGNLFTGNDVNLWLIRSGKRNLLNQQIANFTTLNYPVTNNYFNVTDPGKVVQAGTVEYREKWQVDPEQIFRRNYYYVCNEEQSSLDCNGILEKTINPYVKGLLGNFRPVKNYVFYGSRNNVTISDDAHLRTDGYLASFENFWSFSGSHLYPAYNPEKWVWASEMTRMNAQSQPLETRDALYRYTSTQYGFKKKLPVSVTRNSEYGHAFFEGFEDNQFNSALLNEDPMVCPQPLFSLSGVPNSTPIDRTLQEGVVHSGKYALLVKPGQTATKPVIVKDSALKDYHFLFGKDTTSSLVNVGGNIDTFYTTTGSSFGDYTTFSNIDVNTDIHLNGFISSYSHYMYQTSHFREIPALGNYNFKLTIDGNHTPGYGHYEIFLKVYDGYGTSEDYRVFTGSDADYVVELGTMNLCKGVHKFVLEINKYWEYNTPNGDVTFYGLTFEDANYNTIYMTPYKDLEKIGCEFVTPIKATDSMLNPSFYLRPGDSMLLSAWVKEDCSIPCFKDTYDNASILLDFNSGTDTELKPTGNIIEGWQRIEGMFVVPDYANSASILLKNTGADSVYFDDIRIHPYHALMKSMVYDPNSLRLAAELDENNYATFYEYDAEGGLVRVKKETINGIKTIKETRSHKQESVSGFN